MRASSPEPSNSRSVRARFSSRLRPNELAGWCVRHLGSAPAAALFEAGHLSAVYGLLLEDGRQVVVKARPAEERLQGCFEVQKHLFLAGYPCPEPICGPLPLSGLVATAEAYLPGGEPLPRDPGLAPLLAAALHDLVRTASTCDAQPVLNPAPPWVRWDHGQPGTWPPADDSDIDLNALPDPAWLSEAVSKARRRLLTQDLARTIGHVDWYQGNLRWIDRRLHAVHDWDSLAYLPEAAIAGSAAVIYLEQAGAATSLVESQAFLEAYQEAAGRSFMHEETEVFWAASVWHMGFDAKKQSLDGTGTTLSRLRDEWQARLSRAGM